MQAVAQALGEKVLRQVRPEQVWQQINPLREKLGAVGQKRVAQAYRHEQMLEQYRALYAETARAHGLPDETDSEELWLELGSN